MTLRRGLRRAVDASVSATGVVLLIATMSIHPTSATWNDTEFAAATFASGVINPVTSLSCGAGAGLLATAIGFTWTQPDTTTSGVAPKGYVLSWSGSAGSGSVAVSSLTGAIPGGLLSVLGTATVSITATSGLWSSTVSTVTRTVTTISALGVIVSWTCA